MIVIAALAALVVGVAVAAAWLDVSADISRAVGSAEEIPAAWSTASGTALPPVVAENARIARVDQAAEPSRRAS